MKRLFGLVLAGLFLLAVFSAPAVAGGDSIRVMTRNQYLGADLTPFFTAQTPEEFFEEAAAALQQIASNNFRIRARRFATEVKLTGPDVIGLQEVFDFKLNGQNPGPPFLDQLQETLDALAARGLSYVTAAVVVNFNLPNIPISFDISGDEIPDVEGLLSVVDRDVILVREDLADTAILLQGNYLSGGLCGVQIPLSSPVSVPTYTISTLESTPSADGCNYTAVVQVPNPIYSEETLGEPFIPIERGFVGVDVTVGGKIYRIVNTHLEQNQLGDDPDSAIFQSLQSYELVVTLRETTPDDRTLILVGDFNSSPDDPIGAIMPPYQIIRGAGFADTWDTNRFAFFDPGYTCCQENDLANRRSQLDERIDLIFIRGASFLSYAFVVGRVPIFPRFFPPNWSSDHAGVFARLVFRQDEMGWLYGRWSRRH